VTSPVAGGGRDRRVVRHRRATRRARRGRFRPSPGRRGDFLNGLNAGPDVIAPVKYTNIYTAYDELVRPVTNAILADGATNVKVQDQCFLRVVGHLGLIVDGTVYDGVRDALRNEPIRTNCFAI
jgi:hypothetical protein